MFQHLLVPLDGSPIAEAVVPTAAAIAVQSGARVTLLHVVERHAPQQVHGARHLTGPEEAAAYLAEVARTGFPTACRVTQHVHEERVSDVALSLVSHEDEMGPDLVVLCAHGGWRLRDFFSGNIGQQVVREGVVPVLLRRPSPEGCVSAFPFRRILAPLDGKPEHEAALAPAADLARLGPGEVHLLSVVPTTETLTGAYAATGTLLPEATREMLDMVQQTTGEYLRAQVERLAAQGIAAQATIARGGAEEHIVEVANRTGADLIALGTHGRAGTEAFWARSLPQRLMHALQVSFLLAPVRSGPPSVPVR